MPFMCTPSTHKSRGGKGRPVEIITDNSVETVVFGNTDIYIYIEIWNESPPQET